MDLPPFDPHPIVRANQRILLHLDRWQSLVKEVKSNQPKGPAQARAWLIRVKRLTPAEARLIGCLGCDESWEFVSDSANRRWARDQVDMMFAGSRKDSLASLLALMEAARRLGPDVFISPLKTHIPFLRGERPFAKVRPLARGALDVRIAPAWQRVANAEASLAQAYAALGDR